MSLLDDLKDILDPAKNQAILDAATCWWERGERYSNGGGSDRATAASLDVLMAGLRARMDRIDPYRSPGISSGPSPLENGSWTATIRWFGLE